MEKTPMSEKTAVGDTKEESDNVSIRKYRTGYGK